MIGHCFEGCYDMIRFSLAAMAALSCCFSAAHAQQYPVKPVRLVHSFPPGGSTDLLARTVTQKMQDSLGQNIIIETRPGAGTNIGAEYSARQDPDGYTLYLGIDATMVMNPWMSPKPNFDPVKDFAPISNLAVQCVMFVGSNKAPRKSLTELIAFAKANPGKLTLSGSNVLTQLLGAQLMALSATDMVYVPYPGAPQQSQSLLAGDIDMAVVGVIPYATYIREGRMIGLATTGPKRDTRLPDMPTVREAGFPGLEGCNWLALFAPAGTPRGIIDRLHSETAKALAAPDVRERLATSGMETSPTTPEVLGAMVRNDLAKWGPIIKAVIKN
jgi:tripartite-type tricarboxylate transporter receptor subunit TctC